MFYFVKTKYLLFISVFFIITGCGSSNVNVSSNDVSNERTNKITDYAGRTLEFSQPPKRIISLIPGDMEIIHALGGEIVGRANVDESAISEALVHVPEVGNAHDINFEKVVSLKADLIIGHAGLNMKDVNTVESLGLKMLLSNSKSYETIIETIELYGKILQKSSEAEALVQSLEEKKASVLTKVMNKDVQALIIYGTTESFMAALPSSLSGDLLALAGGTNIADHLPGIDGYPDYAQLSMERVIQSNPDVVYFITHGDPSTVRSKFESELKANPSWKSVNAIINDNLVFLPYELFGTNPGPRIVEALDFLKESLIEVANKKEQ